MRGPLAIVIPLLFLGLSCGRAPQEWRAGLASADPFERGLCALALARTDPRGAAEALPHLLELVDSSDPALAAAARAELERIAAQHVPALLENLCTVEGASRDFRAALRAALVAAGDAAVPALRARLVDPGKASNPREIGLLLVELGARAVDPLAADLADADARRRVAAAWTLGRMGGPAAPALPALERLLAQDAAPVAHQAALALAQIAPRDAGVRSALENALEARAAECGAAVREALARLELAGGSDGRSGPALARLFALGAEALGPSAEACAAKDAAARSLGARLFEARFAALALGLDVERLAWPGRADERQLYQSRLDDKDASTRARAALEVARLGAAGVPYLDALTEHAFDPHPGVALASRLAFVHVARAAALAGARGSAR